MPEMLQFLLSGFFLSFSFVVNYVPINILTMSLIVCFLERVSFLKSMGISSLVVIVAYSFIWLSEAIFSLYYPVSLAQVSKVVENTNLLIYLICLHAFGYCFAQSYLLKLIKNNGSSYARLLGIATASNVIAVTVLLVLYYKVL